MHVGDGDRVSNVLTGEELAAQIEALPKPGLGAMTKNEGKLNRGIWSVIGARPAACWGACVASEIDAAERAHCSSGA